MQEWNVDLAVSGPIDLERGTVRILPMKGEHLPFQSHATLKNDKNGVLVTVLVRADSSNSAHDAGLYFVGRAIDVLCLEIDLPLHLSLSGPQFVTATDHVHARISQDQWLKCFEAGRSYGLERPTFCRALSWFRKGHTSENPVDSFLSYWTSIEIVGAKFARANEKTQRGTVNKICDCFDQLWGSHENWHVIPNAANAVDRFCEIRNQISHGTISLVEMNSIREISESLTILHDLALAFLREWRTSSQTTEVMPAAVI
jgi:hypothetical protein